MATKTMPKKLLKVLVFLSALKKKRILLKLTEVGFDQETLDKGWELFQTAVGKKWTPPPVLPPPSKWMEKLDDWENKWFPIIQATLAAHFPRVEAELFKRQVKKELRQADGYEMVLNVMTLVTRIEELKTSEDKEYQAALALLRKRKLTDEVLNEAKGLLFDKEAREKRPPVKIEDPEKARLEQEEAETAVWNYYLEWSKIARTVVKSRRDLKALGFLQEKGSAEGDGEQGDQVG